MPLYSVCIATYQRPLGLLNLLESIEAQVLEPDTDVEIVVVDNDPRTAEDVVSQFAATSRFAVRYFTQPEPNISLTRNVAVHAASGEFLWFVDDDEVAIPECLQRLATALHEFDADGVFGPVTPSFEVELPEWIRTSHAFNRPIGVTGRISQGYRTSNTLVRAKILEEVDGPFDPEYGPTGGSDSFLFRTLAMAGHSFIDSADAFVTESIPENRSNWSWMRRRVRRQGQNYARQTVSLSNGAFSRPVATMLAKACMLVPACAVMSVIHVGDRSRRSRWILRLWSNIGKFEGVAGTVSIRQP